MLSRAVLSILFTLLVIVGYASCSLSTPTEKPTAPATVAPTPDLLDPAVQREGVGLGDFLENFTYSNFFEQFEAARRLFPDDSPFRLPFMLESILERRGWKAVIAYDADNFGAPKAWVLVQLQAGPWLAVEPNVDPMRSTMGIVIPKGDIKKPPYSEFAGYYEGIDMTFETGDEFKQFLSGLK